MTPLPAPADDGSGDTSQSAGPASDMTQLAISSVGATAAPAASASPDRRTREDLDAYIAEVVDNAPLLTSEQRDKLALILRRKPGALDQMGGHCLGPSRTERQRKMQGDRGVSIPPALRYLDLAPTRAPWAARERVRNVRRAALLDA